MAQTQANLAIVGLDQGYWWRSDDGSVELQAIPNRLGRGRSFLVYIDGHEHRRGDAFDGPQDPEGPHYHKRKGSSIPVGREAGKDALMATMDEVYGIDDFCEDLGESQRWVVTPELLDALIVRTEQLCNLGR